MQKTSIYNSQTGSGLVGVMIAAALVAVTAISVSYYVVKQRQVSARIDSSADCQKALKSAVDYLGQDNNSLFITSAGPSDTSNVRLQAEPFGANFLTVDNIPQFPTNITVASGTDTSSIVLPPAGPPQSFNNTTRNLNPNWQFRNSLNVRNTFNRVLALAYANGNTCCSDLDDMLGNTSDSISCGVNFNPAGLGLDNNMFRVAMAAQFYRGDMSLYTCPLTSANVPTARDNATAKIRLQVFTNPGTAQERFCTADMTAYFSSDLNPPLTIMSAVNGGGLCGAGTDTQYICDPVATGVSFDVRTFADTPECRTCLNSLSDNSCPGVQDPLGTCSGVCRAADPGSVFLCRIGEKHWFDMNKNHWEPCEQTQVYGCDDGQFLAENGLESNPNQTCVGRRTLGRVNITYEGNSAGASRQTQTRARITLSNLTQGRAYEIDVRAVDTRSVQAGPSFIGLAGDGFIGGPHFIVPNEPPTLLGLAETADLIDRAGYAPGSTSVSDIRVYQNLAGNYQCQAGDVSFSAGVVYPSMPTYVYPFLDGETCELNISGGSPAGTTSGSCSCSDGICSGGAPVARGGTYTARMEVRNICGASGSGATSDPWCYEDVTAMSSAVSVAGQSTATPTLNINVSAPKKCPVSAGVGRIQNPAGATFERINPGSTYSSVFTALGWNPETHSGCRAEWFISPQVCSVVTDVCGRQARPRTTYASLLNSTGTTANSCLTVNGINVQGNNCVAGSYCTDSLKCSTTSSYPLAGQACASRDTDTEPPCSHPTDCSYGTSRHVPGTCVGARYDCEAGGEVETGVCSQAGGTCSIANRCEDIERICFNSSDGTAVSPEVSCGMFGCAGGQYCGNKVNSGNCRFGGAACTNDGGCAALSGNCTVGQTGSCQAPTNPNCEKCPNNGDLVNCPRLDGGCADAFPVIPQGNYSCSSAAPTCTPGACVRGPEISRGECLKADGTPALLGEAGTRRVDYECRNNCTTCVGCPTPDNEPCTGTDIEILAGCYIDTDAYDYPQMHTIAEDLCTHTDAVVCSVGNRQSSRYGGSDPNSDPGDFYYFEGAIASQFTINWSGPSWCSGSSCRAHNVYNGIYNPQVVVTHTPTGRTWTRAMMVDKRTVPYNPTSGKCETIPR